MLLSSDHGLVPSSKKVKSQITHITQNFTHLIFGHFIPEATANIHKTPGQQTHDSWQLGFDV